MIPANDLEETGILNWQPSFLAKVRANEPIPMLRGSDWAREHVGYRVRGRAAAIEWYVECEFYGLRALEGAVDIDPQIRGGLPVLKDTGFTVAQVLAELAEGPGVDELASRFDLSADTVREMLHGISLMFQKPYSR